tara:strand:- start:208 stop:678 length:471 start_codon:yes stop_codon:yes gene_type:complete
MKYIFIVLFLLSGRVLAEDRITVTDANADKTEVDKLLEDLTWSIKENNLEDFLECFSISRRETIRRPTAQMFLLHPEIHIQIDNYYMMSENDNTKNIMLRYELGRYLIISDLVITRENEKLVINGESIQFKEDKQSNQGRLRMQGMLNGIVDEGFD